MFHPLTRRLFGAGVLLAPPGLHSASAATSSSFIDVLHSEAPAQDRADKLALYGFLIGQWTTDIVAHEPNGTIHRNRGEIHAG